MKNLKMFVVMLVSFIVIPELIFGETQKTVTYDYSTDPGLVFIKDTSENKEYYGNIAGAYYKITPTKYKTVSCEFDILFNSISSYGIISVGLNSRKSTGEMKISFVRSDDDTDLTSNQCRGHFVFQDEKQITTKISTDICFDEKKLYNIKMEYKSEEYVRVVVNGKDEEGVFKLWDSENLKIEGKADFDRVYFGVRPGKGSDIHYDTMGYIYLKGDAGDGPYIIIGALDNVVIKYE